MTEAAIPQYLPAGQVIGRNEAIENYFSLGFNSSEIISLLLNVHGIYPSLRQLRRILKSRGCRRRGETSGIDIIIQAIEQELRGSGSVIGYRSMHQRLTGSYQLVVTRNLVRQNLKVLDPEGVLLRSRHRLQRRQYCKQRSKLYGAHRWLGQVKTVWVLCSRCNRWL